MNICCSHYSNLYNAVTEHLEEEILESFTCGITHIIYLNNYTIYTVKKYGVDKSMCKTQQRNICKYACRIVKFKKKCPIFQNKKFFDENLFII